MGRPKGGKNRYWSKKEKLKIVKMVVDEHNSSLEVSTKESISNGMLSKWVKNYINGGDQALINTKKPGNPLSKYQNKKQLTDLEQLEFENMKLRIENERLKKGYLVKGVGKDKEFIPINKRNMK